MSTTPTGHRSVPAVSTAAHGAGRAARRHQPPAALLPGVRAALLATTTGLASGALGAGARDVLGATPAHAPVELLVAAAVLALGSSAAAVLSLGGLLLAVTHTARAAGHSLRAVEALARRCTPTVVRRVVVLGVGAGLGLLGPVGPAGAAGAAEPDLGWTVTTAQVASSPAASTDAAPDAPDPLAPAAARPAPTPAPTPGLAATVPHADAPAGAAADTDTDTARGAVTVRPGDSLWSISARHLGTSSPARVAAEWPRWYDLNRDVIGPDPDLIHAGQVLVPPPSTGDGE